MARVNVKSLLKSSGVAGLASFWQVASGIFLTPLVLAKVGIEGYGIWALLHGITGSMNTVTGNMSLAFAKLTAEYDTQGRQGELNGLLGSGALMISGATALGIAILWGFRTPILSTLGISDADVGVAGLALGGVLLGVFVRLSLGCYRQILAGLQRTDLLFNARILASFVYFGLALLFLQQGMGIPGLAAAFLAGELFSAGFAWLLGAPHRARAARARVRRHASRHGDLPLAGRPLPAPALHPPGRRLRHAHGDLGPDGAGDARNLRAGPQAREPGSDPALRHHGADDARRSRSSTPRTTRSAP